MMINDVVIERSEEMKKKSIIEIFNEMEYEEEENKVQNTGESQENEFLQISKITKKPKSFESAIEAAIKAHSIWKNKSALQRASSLHGVWQLLKECTNKLSKSKNEALILLDYFDFYSDAIIQIAEYKSMEPQGLVLVALPKYSPFMLGATVSAALATGCSVIVLASEKAKAISLFLHEILAEAGLPEGLFNVVTDFNEDDIPVSRRVNKVFFCGSCISAQEYYAKNLSESFSFFCPNNTAALILESSDFHAAADKIVQATWGENPLFAVSTVVVQESIYDNFLRILKSKMDQFMLENKNSHKFKDEITSEKINKVILEALNAGAIVEKSPLYANTWSPTVIVNYQNQNIEDVPIVKVLICRTAKEGATLINNNKFSLGVSIWSEISSQALETSLMLVCQNVWVNCHGVFQASEPLQPSALSGHSVLGGSDGLLEFMSFEQQPTQAKETKEDLVLDVDKLKVLQKAKAAKQAFNMWQSMKDKRKYIKCIANELLHSNEELAQFYEAVSKCAHFCNMYTSSERSSTEEFSVLKKKIPVGVILLIFNTTEIHLESFISLITFPIVFGNAVIIVLKSENSCIKQLIEHYNEILPKNLLTTITGIKAGEHLASDPNIQAIWLIGENSNDTLTKFLIQIRSHSARSLKHIWTVPRKISPPLNLFQKECLKNKAVWLTAKDQFP